MQKSLAPLFWIPRPSAGTTLQEGIKAPKNEFTQTWQKQVLKLTMKPPILPRLPVKFGLPEFARFSSSGIIQILPDPFERDWRQQLQNKLRLVELLSGISNVTWRGQKGPSSIVIRWIFNKHIICSWQPKRAGRGGLAVFITGTMSHYRFCFWLALKVTLLLSLLFPDYWWNNVVIFLHMVMGYKQQQRLYILNATMLFSSTTSSFFVSLLYMNIMMSPNIFV